MRVVDLDTDYAKLVAPWDYGMDERDFALARARLELFHQRPVDTPRVGEWVRFPDGTWGRIADDWEGSLQTCVHGSFYLSSTGNLLMSGGLEPAIAYSHFTVTDEAKDGSAWLFHHDWPQAGGGRHFLTPFRVWVSDVDRNHRCRWQRMEEGAKPWRVHSCPAAA